MRRAARFIPALAALFFLGACATGPDAASDTRGWAAHGSAEEGAKLAYGTPDSDDVALMFTCSPGSGRVSVSQGSRRAGDGIALSSGGDHAVLYGRAEPDQMNGGVFVTVETRADSRVLRSFSRTGALRIGEGQAQERLPATPQERAAIAGFFQGCGAA